jgi:hypothetical protein
MTTSCYKVFRYIFCLFLLYTPVAISAEQNKTVATFAPPTGWRFADKKMLPNHVHLMVVGSGKHAYPPSINLATEEYGGTLASYLEIVKKINDMPGSHWQSLGTIATKSGEASLSQVETRTEWGDVKMMHTILSKDGIIYIMTVSALKEEFPVFYKDFFSAMRSLCVQEN